MKLRIRKCGEFSLLECTILGVCYGILLAIPVVVFDMWVKSL